MNLAFKLEEKNLNDVLNFLKFRYRMDNVVLINIKK